MVPEEPPVVDDDHRRLPGNSLLRQTIADATDQLLADPPPAPGHPTVTAFLAFDRDTGAQLGGALAWRTETGHEWRFTGALAKKVAQPGAPYAVRLELHGRL